MAGLPRSPLAPPRFPDLPAIAGIRVAAGAAAIRHTGRDDVMLVAIDPGSSIAGVLTRSTTRAAPVLDCERKLAAVQDGGGSNAAGAAFVVNSGNANAFTGRRGDAAVAAICNATGTALGMPPERVFTASTGVIGEPLPHDRIVAMLGGLAAALAPGGLRAAAEAIRTTDTFPKGACAEATVGGKTVRLAGIAKGSGMIAPDMATMLAFVFTDAAVDQAALGTLVSRANAHSFNAITVDSDTSTSDTMLAAATGRAGNTPIADADGADGAALGAALHAVMHDLALQIVRDGEGASKLVEIRATGAADADDADRVARAIANSPLVKTAIAGEDPNWGRIVMAVGKSGAAADRDRLSIRLGDLLVAERGWVAEAYREEDGAAYMKNSELVIAVDLGLGDGTATVWTCDLTHGYVDINADYRS